MLLMICNVQRQSRWRCSLRDQLTREFRLGVLQPRQRAATVELKAATVELNSSTTSRPHVRFTARGNIQFRTHMRIFVIDMSTPAPWSISLGREGFSHHNARRRCLHRAFLTHSGQVEQLKGLHLEASGRGVSREQALDQVFVAILEAGVETP